MNLGFKKSKTMVLGYWGVKRYRLCWLGFKVVVVLIVFMINVRIILYWNLWIVFKVVGVMGLFIEMSNEIFLI